MMYIDDKGREFTVLNAGGKKPYRVSYRKDRFSTWRYLPSIPWQENADDALEYLQQYAKRHNLYKTRQEAEKG